MARPLFSVVVPTCNRIDGLRRVLDGYRRQQPIDLPFEMMVVDDGSTDGTAAFLAALRPGRFSLRFVQQANAGPASARNRALERASGELVLFTGDDIEPDDRLLDEHWRGHQACGDPDAAILGLTRWPDGIALTATMRHIDGIGAQQFSYHYMKDGAEYDFRHFYTSNVSIGRQLLDREPAGFSTEFPAAAFEDAEFAWRLTRHGLRIHYRAAAVAWHRHAYDVRSFFGRQQRCGEMAAILYRKHPALKKWLAVAEVERLRLGLLGAPARRRQVSLVERELELWEQRALSLAGVFEEEDSTVVDTLLHPLFHYAFVAGLASALYDGEASRRVRSALYLERVPPAVREFAGQASDTGLPVPESLAVPIATLGVT